LVSFDDKGAYNGVYKDRLLQRLSARGIPRGLVQWIDSCCSERTATIMVNGYSSEQQPLPQAGLPQGSPLSPILFLFFNADLVQHKLSVNGGAMAFVMTITRGSQGHPQKRIKRGYNLSLTELWIGRSEVGLHLRAIKQLIIHFTRQHDRSSTRPFTIKGEAIVPKDTAKILGVVMDSQLRYKQHIARATTKGLFGSFGVETTSTALFLNSETVVRSNSCSSSRLCLECLEACVRK
jgi:hypothetical protein